MSAGGGKLRIDWTLVAGALFFILIGGGFSIFGGYNLWTTHQFLADAAQVKATVVDTNENCDDDGCTYWPEYRFSDATGGAVLARTRYGASNYDFPAGTEMTVLYNPGYSYVRVPGADNLWLLGGAFFLLGSPLVVIAIWLLAKFAAHREPDVPPDDT